MINEMKVGIVGFGGAGMAQLKHFESIKGCKVVSVFDTKKNGLERAERISSYLNLFDDFDAFLRSNIDAVAICSPDRTHAEYMVKSIYAGKHTLCEKPLTDTIDGCRQVLKAEHENQQVVASVQHQMRYLPVHMKMKELIKNGQLGKVSYLEGYYVHNLKTRASLYDTWRFEDNATPLVYSGCHFVDLLRWLIDDEVVQVMAMSNNLNFPEYPESDLNVVLLRFRSGVVGKVVVAFGAGRPQEHSVRIYGDNHCIENNLLFSKGGLSQIFCHPLFRMNPYRDVNIRNILSHVKWYAFARAFEFLMKNYNGPLEYFINSYPIRLYEHNLAVRASILDFVESVRTGKKPQCTINDAAKTVAVCLAGVESYRTGSPVELSKYGISDIENDHN